MEGNLFLFGMVVSALDMFDFVPKKEHPYLNKHFEEMCYDISPKLVKIKYEETTEVSASKGSDKATLSEKTFIPGTKSQQEYEYLDIKNYVNDVNRENSEVLAVQDQNGVEKEGYTYGLNRISAKIGKEDIIYNYSGRGDVSSIHAGDKKYSYSYDSYGNLLNEDGEAVGALHDKKKTGAFRNAFTYNGEQTDYSTNLQYLRNRYLDTSTGTFLTEDTYRGSLTNLKSHNRYSYAENNPVNKIDPSGHKAKSVSSKKVSKAVSAISSVAKKVVTNVSSSNKASSQKASRSKSSSSTHKAKTTATKKSSHSAKKSSGGGSSNSFLGFLGKKWNQAKSAVKKTKLYKRTCDTIKRVKKGYEEAKKTVGKALKTVKEKTVSAVKTISKKVSDFKKKHPILTGVAIIVVAGALTVATGGAGAGLLGAACAGAFTGSVIGAGAGATFGFVGGLISGQGLKGALNSAAQGFGSGAASGAVSGAFAGVGGYAAGAKNASTLVKALGSGKGQWATKTFGETAGSITDRAINGEKITAEDVAFDLVLNSSFKAGPKVLNKLKNSKPVQAVEYGLSKLKGKVPEVNSKIINAAKSKASVAKDKFISGASNAKAKAASTVSGLKESVGNKLSGAGKKAVSAENATVKSETELPLKLNLQFFAAKNGNTTVNPYELEPTHTQTKSARQMNKLIEQIEADGEIKETIKYVDYNGKKYVVDGHHRLIAAKRLHFQEVSIEEVELPYKGYSTIDDLLWCDEY